MRSVMTVHRTDRDRTGWATRSDVMGRQTTGKSALLDAQVEKRHSSTMPSSGDASPAALPSGTLDIIVLRTLATMGAQHAYGIASRIESVVDGAIRLNQGSLYPALIRLEQRGWIRGTWRTTETHREARYYEITRAGLRAFAEQTARWERSVELVARLLAGEAD